jgi:hypothetical protein
VKHPASSKDQLTVTFRSGSYVAYEDSESGAVLIEFAHARHFTFMRFALPENERERYHDQKYIDGLIDSYHRNPGGFSNKRKVVQA